MKIAYIDRQFTPATMRTIEQADEICRSYAAQGFTLTLRQLYYQFVARGIIPNRDSEYKRLGSIVNDARLAGLIDWGHMEDRTRNLRASPHFDDPSVAIESISSWYAVDKWARQPNHVEVWIEKDALVGVIDGVCRRNDVGYFSCRGYTSQSEIWAAAQRLVRQTTRSNAGKTAVIIHLGDHDPSGIDMTRDVTDRLTLFCQHHRAPSPAVIRIALNMPQIDAFSPPPNPAKLTDSRATGYIDRFGYESWELDALEPNVIDGLIQSAIDELRNAALWQEDVEREEAERQLLATTAERWDDVAEYLDGAA